MEEEVVSKDINQIYKIVNHKQFIQTGKIINFKKKKDFGTFLSVTNHIVHYLGLTIFLTGLR